MKRFAYVFGAVATVVTIITVMVLASPGGSERAASCRQRDWPATANGSPKLVSDGYYAWHNAHGWHLWLKADAGARLTGRVAANARIGLSSASRTVRKGLRAQARALSFSVGGTGARERIDFKAACASKLSFQLGSSGSGPGSANLRVLLGARGQAPTPSFRLQRPALTGVAGQILIGPTCPIVSDSCPPAKPGQGTVRIDTAPRTRGSAGQLVKVVRSDQQGNFSTTLPAGHYILVVEKSALGYPLPKPSLVDVEAGIVSQVTLILDTGIR